MSQHLTHATLCAIVLLLIPIHVHHITTLNPLAVTAGPHAPIQETYDDSSSTNPLTGIDNDKHSYQSMDLLDQPGHMNEEMPKVAYLMFIQTSKMLLLFLS
jgi:hypothetical protein